MASSPGRGRVQTLTTRRGAADPWPAAALPQRLGGRNMFACGENQAIYSIGIGVSD
jgi:hypothetical protein